MVTNHADTQIWGEATAGDVIEAKIRLEKISGNSTLEFLYEWYKVNHKNKELVAVSSMSTSWVMIKCRGIVELGPLPDFQDKKFAAKLLPSDKIKKGKSKKRVVAQIC